MISEYHINSGQPDEYYKVEEVPFIFKFFLEHGETVVKVNEVGVYELKCKGDSYSCEKVGESMTTSEMMDKIYIDKDKMYSSFIDQQLKPKTEIKIGNITIYNTKRLNWLQKNMIKFCFGFDVKNIKER